MVSLGTQPANRKSGFGHSSPTGARAQDLSRQPARPDLWGAGVGNDPGLPDQGTAMCEDGGRVHMYGARIRPVLPPHRAARQERARRARPRRRLRHPPARPADERLADRNPRSRLAGLAGTVRRVGGPAHDPMPAGRDRPTGQARPRRVHRVRRTSRRRWRSGPGHRRCAPPDLPARWRGGTALGRGHRGARAPATPPPVLVRRPRRRRCSWPRLVAHRSDEPDGAPAHDGGQDGPADHRLCGDS